jgi:hypothetical protein
VVKVLCCFQENGVNLGQSHKNLNLNLQFLFWKPNTFTTLMHTSVVCVNSLGLTLCVCVNVKHEMCRWKIKYTYLVLCGFVKQCDFYLRRGVFHKFLVIGQQNHQCKKKPSKHAPTTN